MGIFTNKEDKSMKKETKDEMIKRLCAKAILSGEDAKEARKEVWEMAMAAKDDYLDVVKDFRKSIKEELNKRAERWGGINGQKDELLEKEAAAETRLGEALINGDEAAAEAVEKELDKIHKEIDRIDARLRIFENATFKKSGQEVLAKAAEKYRAYELALADCDLMLKAIIDATKAHINGFGETRLWYNTRYYPPTIGGEPEAKIPDQYLPETLRHLMNDELAIEEIQNM